MPVYEFECQRCGKRFEQRQSVEEHGMSTPPCPSCGSTTVERVPSTFYARTSKKS